MVRALLTFLPAVKKQSMFLLALHSWLQPAFHTSPFLSLIVLSNLSKYYPSFFLSLWQNSREWSDDLSEGPVDSSVDSQK
jgi:hypothetical protein